MKKIVFFVLFVTMVSGCSSSDDDDIVLMSDGAVAEENVLSLQQLMEGQGLEVIESVDVAGDTGFLATDSSGKIHLFVTGPAHAMGYQEGYLRPEGVRLMTQVYPYRLIEDMIGIPVERLPDALIDFVFDQIMELCTGAKSSIPVYLLDEIEGVAEGATAAGYDVSFEDVLLINVGFDAIYSILFTGVLPCMEEFECLVEELRPTFPSIDEYIRFEGAKVFFPHSNPDLLGCNEFVVSGDATTGESVFHGRDFMFPTGDIIQDLTCMAVYLPETGYPFVSVGLPGFVGQTTALNSMGLSMGMDVVKGGCTRSDPGIGCLLALRDIIQNASDIDEAVERMMAQDRGVSWLYIIADDEFSIEFTHGLVIEEGMSSPEFTGPDLLSAWQRMIYSEYISMLEKEPVPVCGLMFRDQEWLYPEAFASVDSGIYFPDQAEDWEDVVMVTNNYIIPRMVFTTHTPWMRLIGSPDYAERSMVRYGWLIERMEASYGSIDFAIARDLIDFLNPNSVFGDTGYYEAGGQVEGHHAIMDNNNLVMEALFGYYGPDRENRTPWARVDLGEYTGR